MYDQTKVMQSGLGAVSPLTVRLYLAKDSQAVSRIIEHQESIHSSLQRGKTQQVVEVIEEQKIEDRLDMSKTITSYHASDY